MISAEDIKQHQRDLNHNHPPETPRARPGYLYHATLLDHLGSIMRLGLGAKQPKNFKKSLDGHVCLSVTWDSADCYAAEYQGYIFNPDNECKHCVLEVDCLDLLLEVDVNESAKWLGRPISYQYKGIIAPKRLSLYKIRIYKPNTYYLDVDNPSHRLLGGDAILMNKE